MSPINTISDHAPSSHVPHLVRARHASQRKGIDSSPDIDQLLRMRQLLELLLKMVQPPANQIVIQLMQMIHTQQSVRGNSSGFYIPLETGGTDNGIDASGGKLGSLLTQMERLLMAMLLEIQRLTEVDTPVGRHAHDSKFLGAILTIPGSDHAGVNETIRPQADGILARSTLDVSSAQAGHDPSVTGKSGYPQLDQWDEHIRFAAERTGVPANYIKAALWMESRSADNAPKALSTSDPEVRILTLAFMLKTCLDKNAGDLVAASVEYNARKTGNPGYASDILRFYDFLNKDAQPEN